MRYCFVFFLVLSSQLISQADITCYQKDLRGQAREKTVEFTELDLSVTILPKEEKVMGKAIYKFRYLRKEIDTLWVDAIQFDVKEIKLNGKTAVYRVDSAGIMIHLPKNRVDSNELSIKYTCYPSRGMYFINWNNPDTTVNKQVWTQGQGIDNRFWFPGFDDVANLLKITTHVTFDENYPVVSNGDFMEKKSNGKKMNTWTYQMNYPHAMYLVMIAAGDYSYKTLKSGNGINIDQYYYPNKKEYFDPSYIHSEAMMDWFEKEIGVQYPWGKIYRNVPTQDFLFGAMENTTSTIFADYMYCDARGQLERSYEGVNAHELAHQWFGDLVTEQSPQHHWLHESFATHYSKKFMESTYGTEKFDEIRVNEALSAFNAGKQNTLPIANSSSGSSRHYPKGSFVLDMLRNELGNENYRRSIVYYLAKFEHHNVRTDDLIYSIYEATGRNLHWFFDQWVYRGGEPDIEVTFSDNKSQIFVTTKQVQEKKDDVSAFQLPMKLKVIFKSGKSITYPVTLSKNIDTFKLYKSLKEPVVCVILDENMDFLRRIKYKEIDNNLQILLKSKNQIAVWEAVNRLSTMDWKKKSTIFAMTYQKAEFPMVKSAIIDQMIPSKNDKIYLDIIYHGLKDPNHLVRRSAIASVEYRDSILKERLIALLNDSSYINVEHALEKLIDLYPKEKDDFLIKIKGMNGYNNNLKIVSSKYLMDNPAYRGYAIASLKYLASESSEYRARVNALTVLSNENYIDDELCHSLIQGALYFQPWIKSACVNYLKKVKQQEPDLFNSVARKYNYTAPNHTQKQLFNLLK